MLSRPNYNINDNYSTTLLTVYYHFYKILINYNCFRPSFFNPLCHFWYNSVIESNALSNLKKLQYVNIWFSSPDHVGVTDKVWIAETPKYGPCFSFWM